MTEDGTFLPVGKACPGPRVPAVVQVVPTLPRLLQWLGSPPGGRGSHFPCSGASGMSAQTPVWGTVSAPAVNWGHLHLLPGSLSPSLSQKWSFIVVTSV